MSNLEKLLSWAERGGEPVEPKKPKVVWMSERPTTCDGCNRPLSLSGDFFYDARTRWGPWGILGECCFKEVGVGLGTGKGQKYHLESLEKVEG